MEVAMEDVARFVVWVIVGSMALAGTGWAGAPGGFAAVWPPAGLTDLHVASEAQDGTMVAAGAGPEVLVSPDGAGWTGWPAPDARGIRTVAWGGGVFLAIGMGGQPATSPDGIHWTVHQQAPAMAWAEAATWTGERFVAVGGGCVDYCGPFPRYVRTAWSDDGIHWSRPTLLNLYYGRWPDEVVSRNGVVVAGPFANEEPLQHGVLTSNDGGETWQVVEMGFSPTQLVATDSEFFALGDSWTDSQGHIHREAASSTDGVSWTGLDASGLPGKIEDLAFTGEKLQAVSAAGSWTSTDGVHWQGLTGQQDLRIRFGLLVTRDGTVLGLGEQETVLGLGDAGWTVVTTSAAPDLVRIASSGSRWVAVGSAWLPGMSPVLISGNGRDWRPVTVPGGIREITDVLWTGDRFLAAAGTRLLSSSDGLSWTSSPAPAGGTIHALARSGGGVLAAGDAAGGPGGQIWWSEDGTAWSPVAAVGAGLVQLVCSQGGLCVAGGYHGLVASGTRGGTWHETYLAAESPTVPMPGIAWSGALWVAAGPPGFFTSPDGITWTKRSSEGNPVDALWTGDGFLALSRSSWGVPNPPPWHGSWSGTLLTSSDGLRWEAQDLGGIPADHLGLTGDITWLLGPRGHLLIRSASPPDLDQPSPHSYLLPAVAHLDGLNGTHWRSDLTLALRDGTGEDSADLYLLRSGRASAEASRSTVTLTGKDSTGLPDIVSGTFQESGTAGAVLIRSNRELTGWSRTFTPAAADGGSYGQMVPMADMDRLQPVQDLIGLREDARFRTDLGLINAGSQELRARIEVRDTLGKTLGTREVRLGPYSYAMLTRFLAAMVGEPVDDAWATVRFAPVQGEDPPRGLAFASVIDNTSGDPTLQVAAPAGPQTLVLPVAVHLPGYNATQWRTDLEVVNTGEEAARFTVEYWPAAGGGAIRSGEIDLAGGAAVRYPDVVAGLVGAGGKGTLVVRPSRGTVAATSRTYTLSGQGSYGQAVPAVPLASLVPAGGLWVGLPTENDPGAGFRASVGCVNLTAGQVDLFWYGSSNSDLSLWSLPARSLHQLDHALAHEEGASETVRLSFETTDREVFPVLGYVSLVDNRTGDPVFYPADPVER